MKKSNSCDDIHFTIFTIEIDEIVAVGDEKEHKPFSLWDSEESDTSTFELGLSDEEDIEYERCAACGKNMIVGEQGDYVPSMGNFLCYYSVNSCQYALKDLSILENELEKTVIFREVVCHSKTTKRRYDIIWCGNVTVYIQPL